MTVPAGGNRLHPDRAGMDVLVRGSKGVCNAQHVVPGPKAARWIYRLICVEPGKPLRPMFFEWNRPVTHTAARSLGNQG
jgi:hypothetical protein